MIRRWSLKAGEMRGNDSDGGNRAQIDDEGCDEKLSLDGCLQDRRTRERFFMLTFAPARSINGVIRTGSG